MTISPKLKNQRGAVLVLFAVLLTGFITFVALAIDFSDATVILNELQNAADAGALAGAHELVLVDPDDMTIHMSINRDRVNELATEAALKNLDGMNGTTIKSILIGHWTFPNGPFEANDNLFQELTPDPDMNNDTDYVNAVEVTIMRSDAYSAFARWFHSENYQRERTAVAVVGASPPGTFEQPLAVCLTQIIDADGNITCQSIRESNDHVDTGGWTNFGQPCGVEGEHPKELVCSDGNPKPVFAGGVKIVPGEGESAFKKLRNCWLNNPDLDLLDENGEIGKDNIPDQPWALTLPVINCAGGKVSSCEEILGTIEVKIIWISEHNQLSIPQVMMNSGGDPNPWIGASLENPWQNFAQTFNLDGGAAEHNTKQFYLLPSCNYKPFTPEDFAGDTQIPVLVR